MLYARFHRRYFRSAIVALTLMTAAFEAHGIDTYEGSGVLHIPTLGIGGATFSNVVLTVNLPLVRGPSGSLAVGTEDAYDPTANQLTVPAVKVGSTTFYNAVVTVKQLSSIGSVSGADTFDGTNLVVRNVRVGTQSYHDVTLHVGLANVARVSGGMPSVSVDQFDAATGQLTIAAVQVGTKVFTNVVLNIALGDVVAVGGFAEGVVYSFQGGADGNAPVAALVMDASGNLYGTTSGVASTGFGTVFKLTPNGSGGYTESVLHTFTSSPNDGGFPLAGVVLDANGNVYGTTSGGGSADFGVVFMLAPNGGGGYTESLLYSFTNGADGGYPHAGLLLDAHGNLYGTTQFGGSAGFGTVFQLTPTGGGSYAESVPYSFHGTDGEGPQAGLIWGANGSLYGTTAIGGSGFAGTVFELVPHGGGSFTENVLYNFTDGPDGGNPLAGLVLDAAGNLYGTASTGGSVNGGTVFKLAPSGTGSYTESVLHTFGLNPEDGVLPVSGLIIDAGGTLYGTASTAGSGVGDGTVFKLTPNGSGYTESVLYSFQGSPNGNQPEASLVMDASGNLFGTTLSGGPPHTGASYGVVFEIH